MRANGPETSREAAEEAISSREILGLQARTLAVVEQWPGKTAQELSEILGDMDPRTINRRLCEVARVGRIHRGGARPCEITKRRCLTWWPSRSD